MPKEIAAAVLAEKEERRLIRGHLWAYRNEFASLPEVPDGGILDIFTASRRFVGRAFFQSQGGIAARILSRHQEPIDRSFFHKRLEFALSLRKQLFPKSTVYRWIHGESDGLPGIVADRYVSAVVLQTSCHFYRNHLADFIEVLMSFEGVASVLFSCPPDEACYGTSVSAVNLELEGVCVEVPLAGFQKTGLFLDQRCNWPLVRRHARNARVLDGYCYHGLWSCHAALAGARHITAVDTSESALQAARKNALLNRIADRCVFRREETEKVLLEGEDFDVIILDPPAFAKKRSSLSQAIRLYESVNCSALKLLKPGGILVSCSCSHFVAREDFLEILKRAACKAGKQTQLLELRGAAPDHPELPAMPETSYLKCALLRVP